MAKDPFDDARPGFIKMDDLLGRLVLVVPKEIITAVSNLPNSNGKEYEKVLADTVVLDGDITDAIEELPFLVDGMHWSGQAVVGQLRSKVRSGGMVLGRLAKTPSKTKSFGDAWILQVPTDADKVVARPAAKDYLEQHSDPFN